MERAELEAIIEKARFDRVDKLDLQGCEISTLPESIGSLSSLTSLNLYNNKLDTLPESLGNLTNLTRLNLGRNQLVTLPDSLNNLSNLTSLFLNDNRIENFPKSLDGLFSLLKLFLKGNMLTELPDSIECLFSLKELYLENNLLTALPNSISNLENLKELYLSDNPWSDLSILYEIYSLERVYCFGVLLDRRYWTYSSEWKAEWILNEKNAATRDALIKHFGCENMIDKLYLFNIEALYQEITNPNNEFKLDLSKQKLHKLSEDIGNLTYLTELSLSENYLTILPESIGNLSKLRCLDLSENPWEDLSNLQKLSTLKHVYCFNVSLPRRYWTELSNWRSKWLLDENNVEIRRILIERLGYEKICQDLDAIKLDAWREYSLLKIDGVEARYDRGRHKPTAREPMVLLKMTCPSTGHIHILRVPPEMTSAEAAITWVNHGIHPDEFARQT
jgi:leucine-rich repeat protein SHOC2